MLLQEESLEAMKKTKLTRSLLAAVSIVALSAVMYGCVHSGDSDSEPAVEMPDPPTAYEAGKAAIMAATTAEAAQAAYDEVDQTAISGQEAASLQAALDSQLMALDTAARVEDAEDGADGRRRHDRYVGPVDSRGG